MPEFVLSLRQLVASGTSIESAAASVGVSKSTAHRMLQLWGMGGKKRRLNRRLSDEQRQKIGELLSIGLSHREVSRRVACDHRTVARYSDVVSYSFCRPRRCCSCGYRVTTSECLVCLARVA
ncbi:MULTISPECIES: helix-turn-helix domain-containing protein [Rosistilla]|uniref:helix-turn-helix domain-containing protein n=1 Tax=Rosistilla oblonga TaxID=2527990 RepID=UPI0011A05A12